MKNLYYKILRLDKKKYGAYKSLKGVYDNGGVELDIFHVQGDPYAQPSRLVYRIPREQTSLDSKYWSSPAQRIACADFLHRKLSKSIQEGFQLDLRESTQGAPYLKTPDPCEVILPRTAVLLTDRGIEFRLFAGLPGQGRLIEAKPCAEMICEQLPSLCGECSLLDQTEIELLAKHVQVYLKQEFLREELRKNNWIAFIENGSILPRENGFSSEPMADAIPFESPAEFYTEIESEWGTIKGMALSRGVHLLVGGAFQGKSTLLEALKVGAYNHIPGDGREGVITPRETVELRSENGRVIRKMNLEPFFSDGVKFNAKEFSTKNASGSTSQAASFIEAMQFGAQLLLLDEDECSVNFLYKDALMKQLVGSDKDSLNPLMELMPSLRETGLSMILVAGASSEYFKIADCVMLANSYKYTVVTDEARALVDINQVAQKKYAFKLATKIVEEDILMAMKGAQRVSRPRYKESSQLDWAGVRVNGNALQTLIQPEQTHALMKSLQKWVYQQANQGDLELAKAVEAINQLKLNNIDDGGAPDLAMFLPVDFWRLWYRTQLKSED